MQKEYRRSAKLMGNTFEIIVVKEKENDANELIEMAIAEIKKNRAATYHL